MLGINLLRRSVEAAGPRALWWPTIGAVHGLRRGVIVVVISAVAGGASAPAPAGIPDRRLIVEGDVGDGAVHQAAARRSDWAWRGRVAPGKAVEIRGVNGDLHAEAADGDEVEVLARFGGEESASESIRMVVLPHDAGVTICAVYPSGGADRGSDCRPDRLEQVAARGNDVEVDFRVRVPPGVGFVGRTVNGDIDAVGLGGYVKAQTVNGEIDVVTGDWAEATTVNGSIHASLARAEWSGTLYFESTLGGIVLDLPAELNSDIALLTVDGNLSVEYPVTVDGAFSPRRLKGRVGTGGRTLSAKTVKGNIQLRRS